VTLKFFVFDTTVEIAIQAHFLKCAQGWVFAMAKRIFTGAVEKLVKTGKYWKYSYTVCFILVF